MNLLNQEEFIYVKKESKKKVIQNYSELKKGLLKTLNRLKQSINIPVGIKEDLVDCYIEDLKNNKIRSFSSFYYNSSIYKVFTTNELIFVLKNNAGIEITELLNINKDYSISIDEMIFKNLYIKDNKCYLR